MEFLINAQLDQCLEQLDQLPPPDQRKREQSSEALQIHIQINRLAKQLAALQRINDESYVGAAHAPSDLCLNMMTKVAPSVLSTVSVPPCP